MGKWTARYVRWTAVVWFVRIAALGAAVETARLIAAGQFRTASEAGVAAIAAVWLQTRARRQALGWVIDAAGERQKVTGWNRGVALYDQTWTRMQRIAAEEKARGARRFNIVASGLIGWSLVFAGWYAWLHVRDSVWMGGLLVFSIAIGGVALLVWIVSTAVELFYLAGWQDMFGAQVLDPAPGHPGLADVAAQKAHGDARVAVQAEAIALLTEKAASTPKSAIYLGEFDNPDEPDAHAPLLYDGERHLLLFGPNGSGKGRGILIPNLLRLEGRSIVVIDPKGELAAITSDYRRKLGQVCILNPFGLHGLENSGFNPLASLDPDSPTFFDDAAGLGEALIKIEEHDPHWSESAQGLLTAIVMWEVKTARLENRAPVLENVRRLMTEASRYESGDDGKPELAGGFRFTILEMIAYGGPQIESLISRFKRENDEIAGIQSTADRQTWWMLSEPMRESLSRNDIDFSELKERPITVYVVLPAERMRTHSVWLRLVIVSALRALYKPGGLSTLFMIDEFAALGHLPPIEDAFGLVRGYGVQLWPILQDKNQLATLYKERWETFVANAGVVQGFTPGDGSTAEWMSREAGETTVVASGYNAGDSQSSGNQSQSHGMSYQQTKRRLFLPQELRNFPKGTGLIFPADTSLSITYYAKPHEEIEECKGRARPNPYHQKP